MLQRPIPRASAVVRDGLTPRHPLVWNFPNPALWQVPYQLLRPSIRTASSSSARWKTRQAQDSYAKSARVAGLKSRAAYKLLEINQKYHLFTPGTTVVDLGYAPGSWSQVAVNRTSPGGRVVGIDVIPAQPPRGASSIQGNFLSPEIQAEVRQYVQDYWRGRPRKKMTLSRNDDGAEEEGATEQELEQQGRGYVEMEKHMDDVVDHIVDRPVQGRGRASQYDIDTAEGRVVDVVLSDMMMNTSGMPFRDHAGSMDLCLAALTFCYDTLRTGGHFLCKFYQGSEDHGYEMRMKKLFDKVHRIKPNSSRSESKETYFVGLRRKPHIERDTVLGD